MDRRAIARQVAKVRARLGLRLGYVADEEPAGGPRHLERLLLAGGPMRVQQRHARKRRGDRVRLTAGIEEDARLEREVVAPARLLVRSGAQPLQIPQRAVERCGVLRRA